MFWVRKRVIFLVILCLYSILFFMLILYWMYKESENSDAGGQPGALNKQVLFNDQSNTTQHKKPIAVEVWGKASISLYLWKHILNGHVESFHNGFINTGTLSLDLFEFSFKNGPGFIQTTVPQSVEYLVLVLNGRSADKVKRAEQWLTYLTKLKRLKKVCVVMLGSEQCENDWILPYMRSRGGKVDVAFLVYDSPLVDNREFFQWPLGVAVYRGFSNISASSSDLLNIRPWTANFVGTVYKGSSRETLVDLINEEKLTDKIKLIERQEWIGNETPASLRQYVAALQTSDLTLSPVGINSECYRIYEALSLGSVPVVEDTVTPGKCDRARPAPLRLLKQHHAPVIWVRDWSQLRDVLHAEQALSFRQVTTRRINIVNWYKRFKHHMKEKFLTVLKDKFI